MFRQLKLSYLYLFIVLSLMALSGCTNINRFDNSYKTPTTKGAHYVVFGKPYKVLTSSSNYDMQGIASWYGTQFQHHYAANGSRYNMYKLTAAHKSLPLATYVLVTNLSNGKQVIVKVTDRGPFVSNRLIDLSYAAAKKIGMVGQGVAKVSVKAIAPV